MMRKMMRFWGRIEWEYLMSDMIIINYILNELFRFAIRGKLLNYLNIKLRIDQKHRNVRVWRNEEWSLKANKLNKD